MDFFVVAAECFLVQNAWDITYIVVTIMYNYPVQEAFAIVLLIDVVNAVVNYDSWCYILEVAFTTFTSSRHLIFF